MAKCEVKMPGEFLKKVSRLGDKTDEIIEKSLVAGGKVVKDKVASNLNAVIGRDLKHPKTSTGELQKSLGISPVDVDHKGIHNIKVGFNEPRKNQPGKAKTKRSYGTLTNAMIANTIEYGKHGQPAKPFLKPARTASRKQCIDTMKRTLDEEIEKI